MASAAGTAPLASVDPDDDGRRRGGLGYVLLLPAVLLALLVPDALVAVGRRPVLRFDGSGIAYDGWSAETSVRWEDVERVELESARATQRRVLVVVKPGAVSYQARWRRIVLPVDGECTNLLSPI